MVTNVLVTGATGLIGRRLVNKLTAKGLIVHVLTTSKSKFIEQKNVVNFLWDPSTGYIDPNCITDVRSIIHLAGATIAKRWTKKYKQEIIDSRVKTANMLYDLVAASEHKPVHFISASAIGIYPSDKIGCTPKTSANAMAAFYPKLPYCGKRLQIVLPTLACVFVSCAPDWFSLPKAAYFRKFTIRLKKVLELGLETVRIGNRGFISTTWSKFTKMQRLLFSKAFLMLLPPRLQPTEFSLKR